MKLLLIRHADPDYARNSLTPKGFREAWLLASRLSAMEIRKFYSSPLGRARDTAAPTLEKLNREAEIQPWLREFQAPIRRPDAPDRDMVPWDWFPGDWTAEPDFFLPDRWYRHPAMEAGGVKQAYDWVCQGLDQVLAEHGYVRAGRLYRTEAGNGDTLAFFCHFGVECVLLSHLLNISPMPLWHGLCAAPSSVTTLVTEERRKGLAYFRMSAFGDISHLYAAGEEPAFSARFRERYENEYERRD